MKVYCKTISGSYFNTLFKDRLRDFYVYQFKEDTAFHRIRYNGDDNRIITDAKLNADSRRLQSIMSENAHIKWSGSKHIKKCVSFDSRTLNSNPFFELYRCCNIRGQVTGETFAILLIAIMYFKSRIDEDEHFQFCNIPYRSVVIEKQLRDLLEEEIDNNFDGSCTQSEYKKKQFRIIDKKVRVSFEFEDNRKLAECYTRVLMSGRAVFINESNEFDFCDDYSAISVKHLEKVIESVIPLSITTEQLRNVLNEFAALGVLAKDGHRFNLGADKLPDFNDKDFEYRFKEMIKFYSETQAFGEVGSFLLYRMDSFDSCFSFKHNYLLRALNDYNIIDILYAIRNKKYIDIGYRSSKPRKEQYKSEICFPIEIRENTVDGRQYLIGYSPEKHCVSRLRLDSIEKITIGSIENPDKYENEIERCREIIKYSFGVSFSKNAKKCDSEKLLLEHIEVILKYNEDEQYIKRRVQKELDSDALFVESINYDYDDEKHGKCIRIVVNLTDTPEFVKWIRSFTRRVVSIKINGNEYEQYHKDVKTWVLLSTGEISLDDVLKEKEKSDDEQSTKSIKRENTVEFIEDKKIYYPHNCLFNGIMSRNFEKILDFLFNNIFLIDVQLNKEEKYKIKLQHKKEIDASIPQKNKIGKTANVRKSADDVKLLYKQMDYFEEHFQFNGSKIFVDYDEIKNNLYLILPLLTVETQWLNNILQDDKALLFLSEEERQSLLMLYQDKGLFSFNDIKCYNQFSNNKLIYKKSEFQEKFRTILQCINNKKALDLSYPSFYPNKPYTGIYKPLSVEYSKRDDTFRLLTIFKGEMITLNIDKIEKCDVSGALDYGEYSIKGIKKEKIVIEFKDDKNLPDRILNEFSPWEKVCKLEKETKTYTLTLSYNPDDILEITVRLLGYGRNIHIVSDTGTFKKKNNVKEEFTERINRQNELFIEIEKSTKKIKDKDER